MVRLIFITDIMMLLFSDFHRTKVGGFNKKTFVITVDYLQSSIQLWQCKYQGFFFNFEFKFSQNNNMVSVYTSNSLI